MLIDFCIFKFKICYIQNFIVGLIFFFEKKRVYLVF